MACTSGLLAAARAGGGAALSGAPPAAAQRRQQGRSAGMPPPRAFAAAAVAAALPAPAAARCRQRPRRSHPAGSSWASWHCVRKASGGRRVAMAAAPSKGSVAKGGREWSSADDDDDDDDDWDNDDDDDFDEDIEIFNFETGWNLDGMDVDDDDDDDDEEDLTSEEFMKGIRIPQKLQRRLAEEKRLGIKEVEAGPAPVKRGAHTRLKIITGKFGGARLLSPKDEATRPMMEKVRGAVFSMIESYMGCPGGLPEESRWLDLYSGTGAVGLEGMSRGCREAHFCEYDPWTVQNVLGKNLDKTGTASDSTVHTMKVEQLLQRVITSPLALGGPFDFVSVTPPYVLVTEELVRLLDAAPIYHENTVVIFEYARREKDLIPDTLGPLVKIRDRKYGRTFIAIYGPLYGEDD